MIFADSDSGALKEAFDSDPVTFGHALETHPLVQHEALVDLVAALPPAAIEHHRGTELPLLLPDVDAPLLHDDPVSIARGIESNGCWMVLWNVEQVDAYRRLLDEVVDEALGLAGRPPAWAVKREAFIFLSAPDSVTPAHIDPEHNLLLQIRGTKRMSIGSFADPVEHQAAAERMFCGAHRNLAAMPEHCLPVELTPGRGVYVPVLAPHWVHNGPELCISLSITFRTHRTERDELVHVFNHRARTLGAKTPRPPGQVEWLDRGKAASIRGTNRVVGRWSERRRARQEAERYGPTGTRVR